MVELNEKKDSVKNLQRLLAKSPYSWPGSSLEEESSRGAVIPKTHRQLFAARMKAT